MPATISRGTATLTFTHDTEHQRYKQVGPDGTTLYLGAGGAMAEKFTGSGGASQWNNYLTVAGQLVGMYVEKSDETVATRYFHKDHLGSIAVITDEAGAVLERLSYDAWGRRRFANGTDDPSGSITSQTTRGFTEHEQLAAVGLVHMNGRVYDPVLARFGSPDPMTESPFSTQGWNRYSYVGNSPVNFTDPSGYCFMGCFWKPVFKAVQKAFRNIPFLGMLVQVVAGALCPATWGATCAIAASVAVAGVTSGKLGIALKAGLITAITYGAFQLASEALGDLPGGLGSGGTDPSMLGAANTDPCGGAPSCMTLTADSSAPAIKLPGITVIAPKLPLANSGSTGAGVAGFGFGFGSAAAYIGEAIADTYMIWRNGIQRDYNRITSDPWGFTHSVLNSFPSGQKLAGGAAVVGSLRAPIHHVMTNKNWVSTASGGPWSPVFEGMAKKAGMTLDEASNKIAVLGHQGPHPGEYHQLVYDRLSLATRGTRWQRLRNCVQS
jgi:RHS repeat-associated protein